MLAAAWPGAGEVFADVSSDIALAFLERYPSAATAARLGDARMASFLHWKAFTGQEARRG